MYSASLLSEQSSASVPIKTPRTNEWPEERHHDRPKESCRLPATNEATDRVFWRLVCQGGHSMHCVAVYLVYLVGLMDIECCHTGDDVDDSFQTGGAMVWWRPAMSCNGCEWCRHFSFDFSLPESIMIKIYSFLPLFFLRTVGITGQ